MSVEVQRHREIQIKQRKIIEKEGKEKWERKKAKIKMLDDIIKMSGKDQLEGKLKDVSR